MTSTAFELDRFVAEDGRLEVTGRWVGVRGRRFVRPSLSAVVDGHARRALAELEHKPWAAENGGDWMAAFTWSGPVARAQDFELAVAPDLAVRLPPPSADGRSERELTLPVIGPGADAEPGNGGEVEATGADETESADDPGDRDPSIELDKAAVLRAQASAVRRNALAVRERALAQRDKLVAERDAAVAGQEEALAACDQAIAARRDAEAQREAALAARARAMAERDEALAARDRAIAERDDAVAARGVTSVQLERARAELNHAKRDLALWQRALARLRNEPPAADETSAPASRRIARSRALTSDGGSSVSPRVLTLLAIAGAVLLFVIILVTSGGVVPIVGR